MQYTNTQKWRKCTYFFIFLINALNLFCHDETNNPANTIDLSDGWKFITKNSNEFKNPEYNDAEWEPILSGKSWESQGYQDYDGTAWYRLRFDLSKDLNLKTYGINLGQIDDVDETYLNGILIGQTGSSYPEYNPKPEIIRIYNIPREILKPANNILAIRVTDQGGAGGLKNGKPIIADFESLVEDQKVYDITTVLLAAIFLTFAIISFIVYANVQGSAQSLYLFIFLFLFLLGIVAFNFSNFRFIVYDNFVFWNRIQILAAFYAAPVYLFLLHEFFGIKHNKELKIYLWFCHILAVLLMGHLILIKAMILKKNEFHDYLVIFLFAPSLLYPILETIKIGYNQKRYKRNLFLFTATILLVSAVINDIVLFYFEPKYRFRVMHYGFLFFFFAVIYSVSFSFSRDKENKEKAFNNGKDKSSKIYSKSKLKPLDVARIEKSLEILISKEKIFTHPDISLEKLSDLINATPHQLSEYINTVLNTTFSNYIRKYRLEQSKKMLLEHPEKTVLDIAYDSGFNGASTFFTAFQEEAGISPNKYRKQNIALSKNRKNDVDLQIEF
ncbi:MAG: helix-turn-helix domain-containing protein [Spirochaetia bacterium]|nr:helix-turn-helix domain-containing protein [Spirochaetia bacterium]